MKKPVIAVIAAVAVSAGAVGSATVWGTSGNELELIARRLSEGEVAPAQPEGLLGVRFLGSDELFDGTEAVGRGARSCEAVGESGPGIGLFQCTMTLDLGDGQLTGQALTELSESEPAAFTAAVTGGTGRYRHAQGFMDVAQETESELRYRVVLR